MTQHCYDHPRPAVTTDICLFTLGEDSLKILLVRRGVEPFKGSWALPGGFLREDETLDQCAARELAEETGAEDCHLEAFGTFSHPLRDPRTRVITAAYFALVPATAHTIRSGSDADDAQWHSMDKLPPLAFDHGEIIRTARHALLRKLHNEPIAFALLPRQFTLTQCQKVYEAVEGQPLDKRNFRRAILAREWVEETGQTERGRRRPAMLYRERRADAPNTGE